MHRTKLFYITIAIVVASLCILTAALLGLFSKATDPFSKQTGFNEKECNVAQVGIIGPMVTYRTPAQLLSTDASTSDSVWDGYAHSNAIVDAINYYSTDSQYEALVISIDSGGGSPVAAQEIKEALEASPIPVFALVRGIGASAAYYAALGANVIVAYPSSEVGSIGVTASYIDSVKKDTDDGYNYNQLAIGKYKELMSSSKKMTDDERERVMQDLQDHYEIFVNDVATARKMSREEVLKLADGDTMTGRIAVDKNLIDSSGGMKALLTYIRNYGVEPVLCPLANVSENY
jgi:signal peptide peptidase SppA